MSRNFTTKVIRGALVPEGTQNGGGADLDELLHTTLKTELVDVFLAGDMDSASERVFVGYALAALDAQEGALSHQVVSPMKDNVKAELVLQEVCKVLGLTPGVCLIWTSWSDDD